MTRINKQTKPWARSVPYCEFLTRGKMRAHECLVVVVFAICLAHVHAEEEEMYSDKYDYVNALEILENDRLREQYYNCFMDTGPCVTPDAVYFKANFPEAMVTKCKKCTEKQKQNFDVMAEWYTTNKPEEWKAFIEKCIQDAKKNTKAE